MRSRKVILRADGNTEIGMGHVIRSLALGTMLSEAFDCTLCTRFISSYIQAECKASNLGLLHLQGDNHFDAFLEILSGDEIVVLDNYFFRTEFQSRIKETGCKLICIDDVHEIEHVADIVINHSPAAKAADYIKADYTKLLLGLDYALLRPLFLEKARKKDKNSLNGLSHVLICFGGSDSMNLTMKYVMGLSRINLKISVVVGSAYKHFKELTSIQGIQEIAFYQGLSQHEMIALIESVDLALVPSSGILFEVIALKKPFITGYYADNQKEIASYFINQSDYVVLGGGDLRQASASDLNLAIADKYPDHLLDLIDGYSGDRILKEFKSL